MEVVLLLVALLGVALIVWPRIQRRRAGARKPAPARRRRARAQTARTSTPVATWTPSSGDWDDDLGWEGVDSSPATPPVVKAQPEPEPEPERTPDREAWERFRASELVPEAEAAPVDEPVLPAPGDELPSVERWREQRQTTGGADEWDDDGLGWEGESWSSGNGHAPLFPHREPEDSGPAHPEGSNGRAPFFAHGENGHAVVSGEGAAPVVSPLVVGFEPAPTVEPDRTPPPGREWVATDKWEAKPAPPETKTDGNGNGNGRTKAAVAAAPRGRRRLSPVVLVAIYAAAGIAVVILASTLLLGGSSTPSKARATATPAPQRTAAPKATATATPVSATPTPDPSVKRAEQAARAQRSFGGARRSALRAEHRAIARARTTYRRRIAALKRRQQAPASPVVPPAATAVPAAPRSYAPAPPSHTGGGGGGGGGGCEFCIG